MRDHEAEMGHHALVLPVTTQPCLPSTSERFMSSSFIS